MDAPVKVVDRRDAEVDEVELHGRLAEFREALRAEIEAASRAASAAGVALANGRLTGRSAEAYQYVFAVENALSVRDDAPGDLFVPALGRRFEAVVISVQGLVITLSVSEHVGDFVAQAKLTSNLAHLIRKVIGRILGERESNDPSAGTPSASKSTTFWGSDQRAPPAGRRVSVRRQIPD